MNIGNCKNCNKIISYEKVPFCDDCQELFLSRIKKFINENGISTTKEISEETKVPLKMIEYFIEEGILEELKSSRILEREQSILKYEQISKMKELQHQIENDIKKEKQNERKNQYHYINSENIKRR